MLLKSLKIHEKTTYWELRVGRHACLLDLSKGRYETIQKTEQNQLQNQVIFQR
jgi:hypothetical protein